MSPEEIRAHAEGLIRDHATDIEWLTIGETLPDSVPEDQADEVMKKVDDLIRAAKVTVAFPGDRTLDGLTDEQLAEIERSASYFAARTDADLHQLVGEDVPALLAEVNRQAKVIEMLGAHLQGGAQDVKDVLTALTVAEADRDRAREIAIALEQQLAEIKRLAYMGGQNGEVVRGWILGVFERANTIDPQGQQDIHVCSPKTCGAVYNQEEDGL